MIQPIRPIRKILIANRGEVAVRIIRACRELGIGAALIYSDADARSIPVYMADESRLIGPPPPTESYLRGDRIIQAALEMACDAIHPGFGFLSENADFAAAVQAAGLIFIGPDPDSIRAMGLKTAALDLMRAASVPTLPGYEGGVSDEDYLRFAHEIGYPVLVKAAAGGGGKGMRIVRTESDLSDAIHSARREAAKAFADDRVFLEKYIDEARHIEFQIFADRHGNTVHLFERECSIQRRHQKIIEESPSPYLTDDLRARMGMAAIKAAQTVNYVNAGTIEFIVDPRDGQFYFLEMNTRLQVEHPVTELVTGLDLVKLQIRAAQGEPFPFRQGDISQRGHAIECRVYAEDPANGFLPAIGTILHSVEPQGPSIRVDTGVRSGDEITIHYDPMIAKLIVYGQDRQDAIRRMDSALAQYVILGLTTNLRFLRAVVNHPDFRDGRTTTALIERHFANWQPPDQLIPDEVLIAAALAEMLTSRIPTTPAGEAAPEGDLFSPWLRADGFRMGESV
jgi:acetyl-CoA carboxylase biotin carboxylase subunit